MTGHRNFHRGRSRKAKPPKPRPIDPPAEDVLTFSADQIPRVLPELRLKLSAAQDEHERGFLAGLIATLERIEGVPQEPDPTDPAAPKTEDVVLVPDDDCKEGDFTFLMFLRADPTKRALIESTTGPDDMGRIATTVAISVGADDRELMQPYVDMFMKSNMLKHLIKKAQAPYDGNA